MSWRDKEALAEFVRAAGLSEMPMGMFFTDAPPAEGYSPKPTPLPTAADEAAGNVDWGQVWGNFSCIVGNIWRARKKKTAAWFSAEQYGCLGGAFYLGYNKPQLGAIAAYVSSGAPGMMKGERYLESIPATARIFQEMDPLPATKPFAVFKPLDSFGPEEEAEVVCFFARPEELAGLFMLAMFVTNDLDAVTSRWGAGCTGLVTWPLKHRAEGLNRATLGGFDPSCRKYLKTDELTLSMPREMLEMMLARWKEALFTTPDWEIMQKKIARSKKAWGEA